MEFENQEAAEVEVKRLREALAEAERMCGVWRASNERLKTEALTEVVKHKDRADQAHAELSKARGA